MQSVPHIAALAARAGVELRIVSKDVAAAAIDSHRTPDGRTATPTLILIRDGKDAGAWVERPAALQTWFLATGHLSRQDRLARKASWCPVGPRRFTLAEIVALAERRSTERLSTPAKKIQTRSRQEEEPQLYKVVLLNDDYRRWSSWCTCWKRREVTGGNVRS
jgi:hypothetical protein